MRGVKDITFKGGILFQRWVKCYCDGLLNALVSTTNGLERQFETLKYSHLGDFASGSLTDLVTAVVRHFVPECERR